MIDFSGLQNQWNEIFDEYLESQGELVTFYVKEPATGDGVDEMFGVKIDGRSERAPAYSSSIVQGIVIRDLYGSDVPEGEVFAVRQVGTFEPGDVAIMVKRDDLIVAFGEMPELNDISYLTIENDASDRKYIVKNIVSRGLGTPPTICDIFVRKIT